jgi:hypothetical protein
MGFPAKVPKFIEGNRPGKRRAHATMKGTRNDPQPNVGAAGPHRPKKWQRILADAARAHRPARTSR